MPQCNQSHSYHLSRHTTAQAKHQMKGALFLDIVVRKSAAIFELLAGEDKALLVRRDAFLILDLGLDIVDGVRGLDIQRDGLARQRLDEDLHAATETQHKVKRTLFLDVVIR